MAAPGAEGYWLVRLVFQRGLAVVYLVAFLVAARQFRPLAGEDGLVSLGAYVSSTSFRERPSLFRVVPDDRAIGVAAWTGVALVAGLWVVSLSPAGSVPWGVGAAIVGLGLLGLATGIGSAIDV